MKSSNFYSFNLNMQSHDELILFFHERHNEIGLHWSFWPIKPNSLTIKTGDGITVTVKANQFKSLSSHISCTSEESYSYPECVTKWARKSYKEMFKSQNKTGKTAKYHEGTLP